MFSFAELLMATCTLMYFWGGGSCTQCYVCSSNTFYSAGNCYIPDANTPTTTCTTGCYSSFTYILSSAYSKPNSLIRGCWADTTKQCTENGVLTGSSSFYNSRTSCCDTDKCNHNLAPTTWQKCYNCNGGEKGVCGILEFNKTMTSVTSYKYCEGFCSKKVTEVTAGISVKTVSRDCDTSCVEGDTDLFGIGRLASYCCNNADLCNGAPDIRALSGLSVGVTLSLVLALLL